MAREMRAMCEGCQFNSANECTFNDSEVQSSSDNEEQTLDGSCSNSFCPS